MTVVRILHTRKHPLLHKQIFVTPVANSVAALELLLLPGVGYLRGDTRRQHGHIGLRPRLSIYWAPDRFTITESHSLSPRRSLYREISHFVYFDLLQVRNHDPR